MPKKIIFADIQNSWELDHVKEILGKTYTIEGFTAGTPINVVVKK